MYNGVEAHVTQCFDWCSKDSVSLLCILRLVVLDGPQSCPHFDIRVISSFLSNTWSLPLTLVSLCSLLSTMVTTGTMLIALTHVQRLPGCLQQVSTTFSQFVHCVYSDVVLNAVI